MSVYESYELFEIIDGGSCTVKRAVRKDTRQVFAAKLCQTNFLSAKNEVEMLVRLDHPNIVNIYQVFEEDDCIILILQYMAGGQLYEAIGQRLTFSEKQVKNYMRIVLDAVRYCHEMNVVHRDIKPENLLLTSNTPEGILKLADFGISKILSEQMLYTNCGTPIYMAPEIWAGASYDSKVDIWSLGVVMYYLLSGSHPFTGDEDTLGHRILQQQLSFDADIWNLVSSKALDLLRKMLQKRPEDRPSAIELSKHIWFSQVETESVRSQTATEVSLVRTVNKIRRYNFKHKEKRAKNKLRLLSTASESLSYVRLEFLIQDSTEDSNIEDENELNMESEQIEMAYES